MFSARKASAPTPAPAAAVPVPVTDKQLAHVTASASSSALGDKRGSRYLKNDVVRTGGSERAQSGVPRSLSEVLRSAPLRNKFREFLKKKHASESLVFYETVELYQAINDPKWRARAAEGILSKFIDASAVFEVNISSKAREGLLRTTKWEQSSFDDAKAEAYDLMKTNFFAAFISNEFLRAGD